MNLRKLLAAAAAVAVLLPQTVLRSGADDELLYDRSQDLIGEISMTQKRPKASALQYSEIPVTAFRISDLSPAADTDMDYTDWWYSEWDDCRYLFLPVTADPAQLVITYSAGDTLYLNGQAVTSGETADLSGSDGLFQITVGEQDCGTLKVMQSNLGCIYLTTSHGGLDKLDSSRYVTETGTVLMLNAAGGTEYSGEIEKLSAHGNSSWDYSKKKPYNLKLPKKENLYGMGKAKKWVLLSNYLDHAMLRNKLTEEMCKAAGMECVMDSVFVDLYADGSYRGTYQLSERVQIQKNRVNIRDLEEETEQLNSRKLSEYPQKVVGAATAKDYMENSCKYYEIPNDPEDITGGYLLQFQQWNRYGKKCDSGFVTARGQAIGIDGPEYASEAQTAYIRSFVQDAEDAIYSETGCNAKGKHYTDYLDEDSLITAYLVQEISENIDATFSSFFLWKDSDLTGDGKLHFSPAWDFDLSYNNFPTTRMNEDGQKGHSSLPDNLFAAYFPIHGYDDDGLTSSSGSGRPAAGRSWIGQLYQNEAFVKRTSEIYFARFVPFLRQLTAENRPYLTELAEAIRPSADMSNARWHTYGGKDYSLFGYATSGADFMESVEKTGGFIQKRTDWLCELWQPEAFVRGDVNADGVCNAADAVLLQKWLLAVPDTVLVRSNAADMLADGRLDAADLSIMKRALLK